MKTDRDQPMHTSQVDRYLAGLAEDNSSDALGSAGEPIGDADRAMFARCDAVMALAPKLADSSDVAWAFDEARKLARNDPRQREKPNRQRWYLHPGLAWGTAGVLAVLLAFVTLPIPPDAGDSIPIVAEVPVEPTIANFTFAPIVISTDLAQTLAEVQPVVALANGALVDSRSIAVLPFAANRNLAQQGPETIAAESIYVQVVQQLSAIPGLYLIDPSTAAIYADSGLSAEEIALQLGVRGVVEGRVDRINGDVRFELQFTDATEQGLSISEAIERPTTELAMLQTDIAASVLGALAATPPMSTLDETLFDETLL